MLWNSSQTSHLKRMNPNHLVSDIWQKNALIWSGFADAVQNRLGWLDCVSDFEPRALAIQIFAKSVPYSHVVLLGMGGSSLVSRVLYGCLSHPKRIFHVLDTTDPATILAVQNNIPLKDTLFVVASKSGTTIEVDCLLDYFYDICPRPEQFIAITDFNTPLMRRAEQLHFRHIFVNPANIGGRFAALSYFGLVPLALMGGDVQNFLACAKDTVRDCQKTENNPAVSLATFLFENAKSGRNKLTFLATTTISALPHWIEQLIAESTGKHGHGILPVLETPQTFNEWEAKDRMWLVYQTSNETLRSLEELQGKPHLVRTIEKTDDLAKEFFLWEFSTALLGAMMEINPFDEPNVVESKKNTITYLEEPGHVATRIQSACTTIENSDELLNGIQPPEFIGILSYGSLHTSMVTQHLKTKLAAKYHVPVTVSSGPGYLHSTGQFHKGGVNQGRFIILIDDQNDLPIQGRSYGFQTLKLAQALGDFEALRQADRKVLMAKI